MPWRRHPSTASRSVHCARTVARLMDRPSVRIDSCQAVRGEQARHPRRRAFGIVQHACLVGEAKQLGKMNERACALLAADHDEMILESIEPGEEHDSGFVEPRGCLEDVAGEGNGRLENAMKSLQVAGGEPR